MTDEIQTRKEQARPIRRSWSSQGQGWGNLGCVGALESLEPGSQA